MITGDSSPSYSLAQGREDKRWLGRESHRGHSISRAPGENSRGGPNLPSKDLSRSYAIEIAGDEDREEILNLLRACEIYFQGEEEWLDRSTTIIARRDGRIVGTRSFERITEEYCRVYGLCISPEHRGRGLGADLCRRAEEMMYRAGAKGYVGEALNEELAQYYVRKLGVRICRFSLRGWRNNLVPYRKDFRQSGTLDSALRRMQELAFALARMRRFRRLTELFESIARRVKPV